MKKNQSIQGHKLVAQETIILVYQKKSSHADEAWAHKHNALGEVMVGVD